LRANGGAYWKAKIDSSRVKNPHRERLILAFTDKVQCFAAGDRKRKQNTRYCGLRLTCPIDSGIFSTAAVNRL
jgi:hypothetical protein